jgi:hypothetical protein
MASAITKIISMNPFGKVLAIEAFVYKFFFIKEKSAAPLSVMSLFSLFNTQGAIAHYPAIYRGPIERNYTLNI